MYKSPAGPPLTPASPLPAERSLEPVCTPAGIFTFTVLWSITRPSPLHLEQGVSIFCPVPEHSGQACRKLIKPRLDEICPVPLQVEQDDFEVPGSAPDPWQGLHWQWRR